MPGLGTRVALNAPVTRVAVIVAMVREPAFPVTSLTRGCGTVNPR